MNIIEIFPEGYLKSDQLSDHKVYQGNKVTTITDYNKPYITLAFGRIYQTIIGRGVVRLDTDEVIVPDGSSIGCKPSPSGDCFVAITTNHAGLPQTTKVSLIYEDHVEEFPVLCFDHLYISWASNDHLVLKTAQPIGYVYVVVDRKGRFVGAYDSPPIKLDSHWVTHRNDTITFWLGFLKVSYVHLKQERNETFFPLGDKVLIVTDTNYSIVGMKSITTVNRGFGKVAQQNNTLYYFEDGQLKQMPVDSLLE